MRNQLVLFMMWRNVSTGKAAVLTRQKLYTAT